ncbi:two-component sensor histidine kinase [Planotetraspora thailandica]|uniref:Two-component sensor histidine kinase n=1 Tax=Planotetraspora thailandica TaxID=487172 RepID=A0A8J3UVX3_9ACTN|nr:sensor histidine kinase [Planotetraspora thailandica]GII51700.1 two-component sensor histidine kinase [Planotetraspora thailandica]
MGWFSSIFVFGTADARSSRWRRLIGIMFGFVYLFYPVLGIYDGRVTGSEAAVQIVALALFVGAYLATVLSAPDDHEERNRWTPPLLGVITVMALAYPLFFGGEWLALPIYVSIVYSMALPPRHALPGVGGMALIVLADGLITKTDGGTLTLLIVEIFTLGLLFMGVRNTRLLVFQVRQAQQEVARLAATEERLRIARDLHDLLGHSLSLIALKSELARRLAEQGSERVVREVADIEEVARQALAEVREAVSGYRKRCLSEEIDGARTALAAAGVELTVRTAGTPLPDALDGLFGWAVREGVTNVIRHARATRCEITVTYGKAGALLEIADNGVGGPYQPGSGMTGLTERVGAEGGSVEADPSPAGFRLRVVVPNRPAEPDRSGGEPTGGTDRVLGGLKGLSGRYAAER